MKNFTLAVPARLESQRLPKKLMLKETGLALISHTLKNLAPLRNEVDIWLISDSEEILKEGQPWADRIFLSKESHSSGTERIAEALDEIKSPYVLNVQADEPEVSLDSLKALMKIMEESPEVEMATLAAPFENQKAWENPNAVKVLLSSTGRALYFSRAPLPHGGAFDSPSIFHHLGVYAYRRELLKRWETLPKGSFEKVEKLEQLRALENDVSIRVAQVPCSPKGIDTQEDYCAFVERINGYGLKT